jgi:formylmethanofuran dehydrogenase subunit A
MAIGRAGTALHTAGDEIVIRLFGAKIYDPANHLSGAMRDLFVDQGRIVAPPRPGTPIVRDVDLTGHVVMAGAIDLHTHIGGGKVNIARALLPESHRRHPFERGALTRSGSAGPVPSTHAAGYRYAAMGYTACFEPAIVPINARHAHMEMGDTPIVDKGGYAMLGNDDFLLRLLATGAEQSVVNDYVAWTLHATQCLGIKIVNPGGISAFKFNARALDIDEPHPHYRVTPRDVLQSLTRALHRLGVPHPLHVHASNLGVPGNAETTLATMGAAEGLPIHLTHVQFHSYGTEGERHFSSAAARIADAVNRQPNVSLDVGQVMFGQTVTTSGDTMAQYRNARLAYPDKWVCMDIECEAGCGVVPFRYRDRNFVNALQWAIGLELFLRVQDPWRIFLTTDHPNGAPFSSYPQLIRLLMDAGFRRQKLEEIHPDAAAHSELARLDREYSLDEIAILTRAAPARILGLQDRGHLGVGAAADITVYRDLADREAMFAAPEYVFKDGEMVARRGEILAVPSGATHVVRPAFDAGIERRLRDYFARHHTLAFDNYPIGDDELIDCGSRGPLVHACVERTP